MRDDRNGEPLIKLGSKALFGAGTRAASSCDQGTATLSLVEILLNRPDMLAPRVVAAAVMPTAISAAIIPYSIAVAPCTSAK